MSDNSSSSAGGCGCVSFVIFVLVITALFWGLPIGSSKWNIDIFPPRIWDMNEKPEDSTKEPSASTNEKEQQSESP
jgi:hypothetical protein